MGASVTWVISAHTNTGHLQFVSRQEGVIWWVPPCPYWKWWRVVHTSIAGGTGPGSGERLQDQQPTGGPWEIGPAFHAWSQQLGNSLALVAAFQIWLLLGNKSYEQSMWFSNAWEGKAPDLGSCHLLSRRGGRSNNWGHVRIAVWVQASLSIYVHWNSICA